MINNRQAGRRRGRNNTRPQGNGRGGDSGNRIDNRARGNATQLLEKYKNLARDAQTQGDRVNAEYYLQFADHYFRVLADNRARQEEQQGWRRDRDDNRDGDYDDAADVDGELEQGSVEDVRPREFQSEEHRFDRQPERQSAHQNDRYGDRQQADRGSRRPRRNRDDGAAPVQANAPAEVEAAQPVQAATVEDRDDKPKRAPRQKRAPKVEAVEDSHGMDAAILPPSISRADNDSGEEAAPRKRVRRTRPAAEAAE